MTKVSLVRCQEYDRTVIKEKIAESLHNINFPLDSFAGKKVVLKPNFLVASKPEAAIITHPEFFAAAAEMVKIHGGQVLLLESPATDKARRVIHKGGYEEILAEYEIPVADARAAAVLFYNSPRKFKRFQIFKDLFDADIIINLPKLKTHGITTITAAAKNLFGVIPGLEKSRWHTRAPSKDVFSELIIDLNEALLFGFEKPKTFLHFMDAIIGMEGDGPGPRGKPHSIGVIIAGTDAVAVDYVAAAVLGLNTKQVPTLVAGFNADFGPSSPDEIEVVGEAVPAVRLRKVRLPRAGFLNISMEKWPFTSRVFRSMVNKKPVPDSKKCILCYQCRTICASGAIGKAKKKKKVPAFDYKKCIRCFCCMEICPEGAIRPRAGFIASLLPD